jgi:hypothetical protein
MMKCAVRDYNYKVDIIEMAKVTGSTPEGLKHLDEILAKHPYVSEGPLPSSEDSRVFKEIKGILC